MIDKVNNNKFCLQYWGPVFDGQKNILIIVCSWQEDFLNPFRDQFRSVKTTEIADKSTKFPKCSKYLRSNKRGEI